MPFDDERFHAPATNGEVAGIAIKACVALQLVASALDGVTKGRDISAQIQDIVKNAQDLSDLFDQISGWTDDG